MRLIKAKAVTVSTAAMELGVSDRHIYNLIAAGHLMAYDISVSGNGGPKSIRISMESIHIFKNGRIIQAANYDE